MHCVYIKSNQHPNHHPQPSNPLSFRNPTHSREYIYIYIYGSGKKNNVNNIKMTSSEVLLTESAWRAHSLTAQSFERRHCSGICGQETKQPNGAAHADEEDSNAFSSMTRVEQRTFLNLRRMRKQHALSAVQDGGELCAAHSLLSHWRTHTQQNSSLTHIFAFLFCACLHLPRVRAADAFDARARGAARVSPPAARCGDA